MDISNIPAQKVKILKSSKLENLFCNFSLFNGPNFSYFPKITYKKRKGFLSLVIFKSVSDKNPLNHEFFHNSGVSTYYMVEVWRFMGSAKFRPVLALQGPTGAL